MPIHLERNGFRVRIVPNAWWRVVLPEQRPVELNRWLVAYRNPLGAARLAVRRSFR